MKQSYPTFILDMDILTEGNNLTHAIEMARDASGLTGISMEDNKESIPEPSTQNAAIEKAGKITKDRKRRTH